MWLDGKFIGGSEEVLAGIDGEAEGFATIFDGVEKGEIVAIEEEVKTTRKSPCSTGKDQVSCCFASRSMAVC